MVGFARAPRRRAGWWVNWGAWLPRSPACEALQAIDWSIQKPRRCNRKAETPEEQDMADVAVEEAAPRPDTPIETFALGIGLG
jgi:hypothetical protein